MAEQFGGELGAPDVLTLQATNAPPTTDAPLTGTATRTESPPIVHARATIARDSYTRMQRAVVIRHASDDRIIAMIEVLSAGNKSSPHAVRALLDKVVAALDNGNHLLLVDVHPPGPRDPWGIHGAILNEFGAEDYMLDAKRRLTAVAYSAGPSINAFAMHFVVREPLPEMPLFLTAEHYVRVPLGAAYLAAWEDVPPQYQTVRRGSP